MTLEEMKAVDIRTVDPETLVDIRDVHIDTSLPKEERMRSFLKQIKNPYVFKHKDVVIKTSFAGWSTAAILFLHFAPHSGH